MNKKDYAIKQQAIQRNGYIKNGKYILTNKEILPTPEPPVSKVDIAKYKPKFLQK